MQEALKYHSELLQHTVHRIHAWVASGCANACPDCTCKTLTFEELQK